MDYTDGNNTYFLMLNFEFNGISFLTILGDKVITIEFKMFNV